MKRLFIAVPLSDASRDAILRGILLRPELKKLPVRWIGRENLHLTLQFLGDVEEKRLPELRRLMGSLPVPESAQQLIFTETGCFPNAAAPRVLWLGIAENTYLFRLQKVLTNVLDNANFPADHKRFRAHLTLGRVREGASFKAADLELLEKLAANTVLPASPLNRVILFESQLRPGGPIYTSLFEKLLS